MASELYAWLAEATLATSVAIVLVLGLRLPLRAVFGASAAYAAWGVVPVALLATLVPAAVSPVAMPAMVRFTAGPAALPSAGVAPGVEIESWLVLAWILGLAVAGLVLVRQQRRFLHGLGSVRRRVDGLFQSDAVAGLPAVVGWRSRIVLPRDFEQRYDPQQQQLVLCHETVHRQRGDLPASALVAVLRCVFWFNPLVHAAASRFRHDQELACDAAVLRRFPQSRRAYGDALLKTQLADSPLPVGCHWFGSHPLKERIAMLKRPLPGKPRWFAGLAFVALLSLAAGWTAWAAQPPVVAGDGLSLQMKLNLNGGEERLESAVLQPGQAKVFSYRDGDERWDMTLTLTRLESGDVFIAMDILRDGISLGQPRMMTRFGVPAAIEIGDQYPDHFSGIKIEMNVTEPVVTSYREVVQRKQSPVAAPMPWQQAVARWNGEPAPAPEC